MIVLRKRALQKIVTFMNQLIQGTQRQMCNFESRSRKFGPILSRIQSYFRALQKIVTFMDQLLQGTKRQISAYLLPEVKYLDPSLELSDPISFIAHCNLPYAFTEHYCIMQFCGTWNMTNPITSNYLVIRTSQPNGVCIYKRGSFRDML